MVRSLTPRRFAASRTLTASFEANSGEGESFVAGNERGNVGVEIVQLQNSGGISVPEGCFTGMCALWVCPKSRGRYFTPFRTSGSSELL